MSRFALYLTAYIFVLTVFPFLPLFLFVLGLFLAYICVEYYRGGSGVYLLQSLGLVVFTAILSLTSVAVSHSILHKNIQDLPEEGSYAVTGFVIQGLKNNDFLFETTYGKIVLRKADETYEYGDLLLLHGFVAPIDKDRQHQLFVKKLSNILLPGVLKGDFDYDTRLWTKGYVGDIYVQNAIVLDHDTYSGYIARTRQYIKSRIQKIYGDTSHQALLNGMLTGDISGMTKEEYQGYIDSNLVHLVAVSGGNIVMLVLLLHYLFFFLPYKMRIGVISCSIVGYALLVGLDASVFRAMLMGVLTLFALISGRSYYISRSIALAWIVLLVWKPYSLIYDLGFLLSFGALFGILVFQKLLLPYISSWKKRTTSLFSEYFLANIGATFGVLPIILFFIGSINLLGFVANIFVLPIVPFVMYVGALSLFIHHKALISLVSLLLEYIANVSAFVGTYGVYLIVDTILIKLLFIIALLLLYYLGYIVARRPQGCLDLNQD